jgi:protein O-GlcNAc transferase
MGFCGTLGADYVEYMIADECVIPPSLRPYYSEKIISMPHSYFVNDHKQRARYMVEQVRSLRSVIVSGASCCSTTMQGAKLPTRAQYGVPDDKFVFCNFNQIYKVSVCYCKCAVG